MSLVATDGHRLALVTVDGRNRRGREQCLAAQETMQELIRLLAEAKATWFF